MKKSIRLMRADSSAWERINPVIADGEPVIERTAAGSVRIKIGNGKDRFASLPSLLGDTVKTDAARIELSGGKSFRLGTVPALHLVMPKVYDDEFSCEVSFDSGADATELEIIGKIRLSGDDVADEELMPKANTHYTVFVWYDGDVQGIVRGLPNA